MHHCGDPDLRGVRSGLLCRAGLEALLEFWRRGTGQGIGLLLLFLLLAQTEAPFEFVRPGTGQTGAVTAERHKAIYQETLRKDLRDPMTDGVGHGTQDEHRQLPERFLEAGAGLAWASASLM